MEHAAALLSADPGFPVEWAVVGDAVLVTRVGERTVLVRIELDPTGCACVSTTVEHRVGRGCPTLTRMIARGYVPASTTHDRAVAWTELVRRCPRGDVLDELLWLAPLEVLLEAA